MKTARIRRWVKQQIFSGKIDFLAQEEPLEIRVDNRTLAITMRTPGHDEELAAGFLLTEGIVSRGEQVVSIASHPRNKTRNVIGVFLADGVELDLKRLDRHTIISSSCGLCGKTSIEAVRRRFAPLKCRARIEGKLLLQLPERLRSRQTTFAQTGGLHAAGIFDLDGNIIVAREDIGRHNAVDKVLGYGFLKGLLPFDRHVLVVSGRASFEIMQKALAARLPIIAAVSAPSSLAVEFAKAARQTLAGFVRGDRMNIYSEANRILPPPVKH